MECSALFASVSQDVAVGRSKDAEGSHVYIYNLIIIYLSALSVHLIILLYSAFQQSTYNNIATAAVTFSSHAHTREAT